MGIEQFIIKHSSKHRSACRTVWTFYHGKIDLYRRFEFSWLVNQGIMKTNTEEKLFADYDLAR